MQPLDYQHDGEKFHLKLLEAETSKFESIVARLMGNYIFLCDTSTYVPVQTLSALQTAMLFDGSQGKLYTIGDDVTCLFYKKYKGAGDDHHLSRIETTRPKDSLYTLLVRNGGRGK